ncbi:DM4/DM12 family domain-containing protein [Phthorimaea operculella]|nr:DM4/DM12 family domain-containing protein [Phthorimaea operculella]
MLKASQRILAPHINAHFDSSATLPRTTHFTRTALVETPTHFHSTATHPRTTHFTRTALVDSHPKCCGGLCRTILGEVEVEEIVLEKFHGGERALLYGVAEDMLANFGMEGKECLLRAICEIHAHPLTNFGFIGEVMKLFFTPTRSAYASLLQEYVEAQKAGESGGECWPYYRLCPKSIFMPSTNKYSQDAEAQHRRQQQEEIDRNTIDSIKAM